MDGVTFVDSRGHRRRTHGASRGAVWRPTYITWVHMRQRCYNQKLEKYRDYGGRGIRVCERWHVFENFLADMGERPQGKTLDRINNDGNYEPGNCRWATPKQQSNNQRRRRPKKDITGFRTGLLQAISFSHMDKRGNAVWVVHCDCGNRILRVASQMQHHLPQSCGCLRNNPRGVIK